MSTVEGIKQKKINHLIYYIEYLFIIKSIIHSVTN
jgi:hypothetical protein